MGMKRAKAWLSLPGCMQPLAKNGNAGRAPHFAHFKMRRGREGFALGSPLRKKEQAIACSFYCMILLIYLWIIGEAREVIQAHMVVSGEPDRDAQGKIALAALIAGIGGLMHTQQLRQLALTEI